MRLINKSQRGFTLIELLVAIAITGLITGGITTSIFQVFDINTRSTNHMTAVREVQNAGYWISHDAQMAQDVAPDPGDTGFPLVLTWTDWDDNDVHEVTYTLDEGLKELQRQHLVHDSDGTEILNEVMVVARFIDFDSDSSLTKTKCEFTGGVLTLTVTATLERQSETRTYEVIPRPGS